MLSRAVPRGTGRCCVQIKEFYEILVQMEGMLGRYQSDLGNISQEIRSLQEQSSSMSVRLKNRRTVQVWAGHQALHTAAALLHCCT